MRGSAPVQPEKREGDGHGEMRFVTGSPQKTVIDALEDAKDYAAFEMAVTADYEAQSAVERELVLKLANLFVAAATCRRHPI
jgi:hypothetical protein